MELWVWITLTAAAVQTIRFMLQKELRATRLSTSGATFARFGFGAPLAVLCMGLVLTRYGVPEVRPGFYAYALVGGAAQILGTMATVALFQMRNFAVGLTFAKLEVILTAIIGFVVLGDRLSLPIVVAISVGVGGVLALAEVGCAGRPRLWSHSTLLGLAAGLLLGVSGVCYRGASFEVLSEVPLVRSSITLAFVTLSQSLAMAIAMRWREPGQLTLVFTNWRIASLVGLTSMLGSLGWFTAFTLKSVAEVKALAQVELIFAALASALWFGERMTARELIGLVLVGSSVVALVLVA
ncbi:MAG: DMT family transporter [Pseudomonadota bacterium]